MRVAYVYPNPRRELAAEVAAGLAPDTGLLGQNHLSTFGIDAWIHEPRIRRRPRLAGLRHRVTWNLRELTLPWELGEADVAVTPLANVFPFAARIRGRPHVVVLNYGLVTTWKRSSPLRRRGLRTVLRSAAAVACLGTAQRERIVESLGVDPARAHLVEMGIDGAFFTPQPHPANGYVLAVGRDLARDYATLVRAVEGLDAEVRIVGDERNFAGIRLPANVSTYGSLTWRELLELYAGARCVVLPLRRPDYGYGTEGSGLTALLEAMATERPAIVADRPMFSDYVEPGKSALVVPPEDPEAVRAALMKLLEDEGLGKALASRGRELFSARFTTRHLAERLVRVARAAAGG